MREHAREAVAQAQGRGRNDLDTNRLLNLALVRFLEIVDEAAGRVPPATLARYPAIAWSRIVGLRNRLVHAYDQADLDIVWQILRTELPPLATELDRILADERLT
ncbi:MAG: DUF86 domain-containing protein [Actinobacteria bacterium]|nr:DUF86 domain-containing protein [Actinomycetota bacterium]